MVKKFIIGLVAILALSGCTTGGPVLAENNIDFLNLIKIEYIYSGDVTSGDNTAGDSNGLL